MISNLTLKTSDPAYNKPNSFTQKPQPIFDIVSIQKFYNPSIFDKFRGELQRNLKKSNDNIWTLVKLLFSGSGKVLPETVFAEEGLDV